MITRVSFLDMSHEDWLDQRRKTIGGSDAGTLLGLNEYQSPYSLWAEKTGKYIPDDISDKESVRLGKDLEDYVAKRWSEASGKKVRRDNNFVYNSDYPFAHVQADRLVVGENAGLECKTTASYDVLKLCRDGKYPDRFYCQCVHGMMVTGADRWYLAILVFGHGFFHFTIERNEDEITALAAAERDFFESVKNNTPIAMDGSEATNTALKEILKDSSDGVVVDLSGIGAHIAAYVSLKKRIAELEQEQQLHQHHIMEFMGTAERGANDRYKVSYKTQHRNNFDRAAYEADHGAIPSKYFKQSSSRPFRLTEIN